VETLYDRLGVPRDVDEDGLRAAWKRIARTVHPDVGGDKAAFQDLQKAYDVLSHANTRAFYDLALDTYRPGASIQPVPTRAAVPPPEWISDLGGTTVLPTPRRRRWSRPQPRPTVAADERPEPVELPEPPEPEPVLELAQVPAAEQPEPSEHVGRHESGVQASGWRRTPGMGKRSGSTWKRMRAVSVETTRS
jgi:hypothetical protein